MKQRNSVTSLILALLVPFYTYYWWYDTGKGMRRSGVLGVPSIAPLLIAMVLYFVGATTIVLISVASMINAAHSNAGTLQYPNSFLLIYLLMPIMWAATIWYGYRFSKAAGTLVPLGMPPGLMTVVFVLMAALGVYIIQDKINLFLAQPQNPPRPPA